MTKVTIDHSAYEASHGKQARGKGTWVFATTRNADVDDMFFASYGTLTFGARQAAKHFDVTTVFVQP